MVSSLILRCLAFLFLVSAIMAAPPRRPIDVPFQKNYVPTWATDHIKYINGGNEVQLSLDKYTGTGFQTKGSYLFGHFSMQIKMVPGDSAGTVTAFYLSSQNSEHDEIDFEFLGNRTNQPYILQTNVYTGGKGDREQRIYLWFDPTKDYHSYSVLWNMYQIVFFVDDYPIRVFKNSKDLGVRFPFNQPMKIYSSLWNADDWATRGGLEKTDWSKAPFVASCRSFHVDGCDASVMSTFCATQGKRWWDQKEFQDLDGLQNRKLSWVRQKYTIYNYCTDRSRYPSMPPECKRDRDAKNTPFILIELLDVPQDYLIMNEEIFGPLLPIITVEKIEGSFDMINLRSKPLAAYLFTKDKKFKKEFVKTISSGGMLINDACLHFATPTLPFGGVGESGIGSYHGKFSFDAFSHKKAVLYRSFGGEASASRLEQGSHLPSKPFLMNEKEMEKIVIRRKKKWEVGQ